ncbi:WD40-repeat-containing domain protein [Xylaria digitata]|nr:WD40-repeat-containing domain protein [Xylaria digitata]
MSHDAAALGRLCREYVLSPITAFAFLTIDGKQYLLAAEDTDIKVYDAATTQLCGTLTIFHAQPIHGISAAPAAEDHGSSSSSPRTSPWILVWGGHTVKVLPGHVVEELIFASSTDGGDSSLDCVHEKSGFLGATLSTPEAIAPDWVFGGRISPFDDNHIVLLTAHNEVIQGHVGADQKTLILGRVQSPSRPILYSGNLFWVERNCVLVAAGTVFGEIVVWKCHLSSSLGIDSFEHGFGVGDAQELRETVGCEVLFIFSGHEGSVFGVHISPEILTSAGERIRLLASCSDDRTIRIWDITERRNELENQDNGYEAQISGLRETGFGDSITGPIELASSPSRCIAMAMGHISRIWQVEISSLGPLPSVDTIEVYSFGEDATMQRWHLELNTNKFAISKTNEIGVSNSSSQPLSKLTHHETFSNHSGKQIWSHAMISNENGLLIATGGGDGKIALMENASVHASRTIEDTAGDIGRYPRSFQELEVSPMSLIEESQHQAFENSPSVPSFKHGNGKEMFQSFTFVTDDRLLVTTRSGRIFLGIFGGETEWKELTIPNEIRRTIQSYTILRSSRRASIAFIGAPNGELFYYHEASGDSLWPIHKSERKITEIICVSDTWVPSPRTGHGLEEESDGCIELLVTAFGSTNAELLRLDQDHKLVRRTKIKVPDNFIVTTAAWCHNYLILGSRNGNISIFGPTTDESYALLLTMEVKIGDKITSILPLPRRTKDAPLYFLTTARDGNYRIYEIFDTMHQLQVRLLHETKPPFGPMVEGSWLFDKGDGKYDLILYGFRSKYFVIWNVTQQNEAATIDCGGGHRVFDQVQIRGNPNGFRFACTKASQMKIFSQTRAPHLPLKVGGHGREIKSVSAASGKYVATGAEDTMIRVWNLHEGNGGDQQLRCVFALEKHNTGIQSLKWYKDQYLFSSGGNEEFFVWRITALESDVCPLGAVCEAVFADRSEVGDLRITNFDVQCLNDDPSTNYEEEGIVAEPETSQTEPEFCISMTLSNSTVQSYLYSAQRGFRLLGRWAYTGACLTQLRHLNFTDQCHPQVLTAATDGHLVVFIDIQSSEDEIDDSTNMLVTKLHQSSIKALDMCSIATDTGTSYLVVTGGDDDAIGVLHLYSPFLSSSPKPRPVQPMSADPDTKLSPAPSLDHTSVSAPSQESTQIEDSLQAPRPFSASRNRMLAQYEIRNKFIVRSAHAAAITGLGIVRLENGERDAIVVTTSNDQRVKMWRLVDWKSASPKVHLLDDWYSGVADAGDLEVVREWEGKRNEGGRDENNGERILVAGVGIEVWRVS